MFFDKIEKLCKMKNISPTDFVEKELHMSRSNVTKWKEGKVPKSSTVQKVASYFGVSTDYLLGNEQKEKPVAERDELIEEIMRICQNLPKEKQLALLNAARCMVEKK